MKGGSAVAVGGGGCRFRGMDRRELLDLYFVDARARLIDIAAFLDRLERASEGEDFRAEAFGRALKELDMAGGDRARRVLLALSDPTQEPAAIAVERGACGAYPQPFDSRDI
jgi:hypothetical protein